MHLISLNKLLHGWEHLKSTLRFHIMVDKADFLKAFSLCLPSVYVEKPPQAHRKFTVTDVACLKDKELSGGSCHG